MKLANIYIELGSNHTSVTSTKLHHIWYVDFVKNLRLIFNHLNPHVHPLSPLPRCSTISPWTHFPHRSVLRPSSYLIAWVFVFLIALFCILLTQPHLPSFASLTSPSFPPFSFHLLLSHLPSCWLVRCLLISVIALAVAAYRNSSHSKYGKSSLLQENVVN